MPKLLIVDDSEPFVNSAVDFFRLEGWEAVGVASAEEAVKVVDPSFDAVLLD
jgi:DNA-binding response OmpR family regulator